MKNLTPKEIVAELDRHIVGQADAKRAVAIAIRNRWRRQQLPPDVARDIPPKNIIMMGPTGVGKTEIARRIADLTGAPFIKVEATKFTEVGYVGRDVESMIRDLLEQAIKVVRSEQAETLRERAGETVEERLLDLLLPDAGGWGEVDPDAAERRKRLRDNMRAQLRAGTLEDRHVEISVTSKPATGAMFANMGLDQMDPSLSKMFERILPSNTSTRRVTIRDAREILFHQEAETMIDQDKLIAEAIQRTEQTGIIFLDEIDKIAANSGDGKSGGGPDVSRQGVQRDLLPIVEGSGVNTRHGIVNTDHILFIAAGAFHMAKPSDLMPELQGRFPIRVELKPLTEEDFVRILTEPSSALTKQQQLLLKTEGLDVTFERDGIEAMAEMAATMNEKQDNIGARRLITIVEKLFEEINFEAPDLATRGEKKIVVTEKMVHQKLGGLVKNEKERRWFL
jgi:ATP-dependent HslUV protease ATP-binding subunit HslU